ncbi:MAG: hypothetical protein ACXWZU_14140 [Actinomycetota bacterium]
MRARILVLSTITAVAITAPAFVAPPVSANGGAYVEFDGTHHMPGDHVTGTVYVAIPKSRMGLLDRGPFYAYVLSPGTAIDAERGLPAGAIRVGTWTVEQEKQQTELTVSFTVPETEGDFYSFGLCNDPCTVDGFGEPVSGVLSVVATAREAALLGDVGRLHSQLAGLKRDLRKAKKGTEAEIASTSAALEASETSREALIERVSNVERRATAAAENASRPLVDPWAAAAAAVAVALGLAALASVLAGRRRDRSAGGPDDVVPGRA